MSIHYVGGLFDGRDPWTGALPGGEPDRVYTWHGTTKKRIGGNKFSETSLFHPDDMLMGGSVGELPDGSVAFLGHGQNNNPCYRITGFEGWKRNRGQIMPPITVMAAKATGTGLSAEYFSSQDFSGEPVLKKVDPQVWFGMKKPWPAEVAKSVSFSARWTGFIESKFNESYTLSVYGEGDFRLLVDGREVEWAKQDYIREITAKKAIRCPFPCGQDAKYLWFWSIGGRSLSRAFSPWT
jgi:hypothetical protein